MSLPRSGIYKNGVQQEVEPTSLPDAATSAKGAVKAADTFKLMPTQNSAAPTDEDAFIALSNAMNANAIALHKAGVFTRNILKVVVDLNWSEQGSASVSEDWLLADYAPNETLTIDFSNPEFIAVSSIGRFVGYALTPNAVVPDYPYLDQNDEPATHTINFSDHDIILYAIWDIPKVTITYSAGDYGQWIGTPLPSQEVIQGSDTSVIVDNVPIEPKQGVAGRFVGWATEDGKIYYSSAEYTEENGGHIDSLWDDIILYPVFCPECTITYAAGNDATWDDMPLDPITVFAGQAEYLEFSPAISCISDPSKSFVGWSETDESQTAEFASDGIAKVFVTHSMTLYPCFGTAKPIHIKIVNNSSYPIDVWDADQGQSAVSVAAGATADLNYVDNVEYHIYAYGNGIGVEDFDVKYSGIYQQMAYENVVCSLDNEDGEPVNLVYVYNPDPEYGGNYWVFTSEDKNLAGDQGVLTISDAE